MELIYLDGSLPGGRGFICSRLSVSGSHQQIVQRRLLIVHPSEHPYETTGVVIQSQLFVGMCGFLESNHHDGAIRSMDGTSECPEIQLACFMYVFCSLTDFLSYSYLVYSHYLLPQFCTLMKMVKSLSKHLFV